MRRTRGARRSYFNQSKEKDDPSSARVPYEATKAQNFRIFAKSTKLSRFSPENESRTARQRYRKEAIEYSYKLEELITRFLESLFRKDSLPTGKLNALIFQATNYGEKQKKRQREFERNLIGLKPN